MVKINKDKTKSESVLILYNIRSAYNVGALFRTADALGITKIYLIGYTPTPIDRFGKPRSDISKSALGAEISIPWESKKTIAPLITRLKKEGFQTIAIEQDAKSVDYKKVKIQSRNAFIAGEEVKGIPKSILEKCDIVAEIPMRGEKESLNVSVATGVALFRILDR